MSDVKQAVAAVRARDPRTPRLALVLGSGLGHLADAVEDAVIVESRDIPGYPTSTVKGHAGRLVLGTLEGCPVVMVQGRVHAYEGLERDTVLFPIRLVHGLGAKRLMLTNAAGGIRPDFPPGTLMFIRDHINWVDRAGPDAALPNPAPAGVFSPYDPEWLERAQALATDADIATEEGVYIWTLGPSYETPAEIRAFRTLGADAVGMSTVPEATEAAVLGLKVLGLSTITNPAAGLNANPLDHQEVMDVGKQVRRELSHLVREIARDSA